MNRYKIFVVMVAFLMSIVAFSAHGPVVGVEQIEVFVDGQEQSLTIICSQVRTYKALQEKIDKSVGSDSKKYWIRQRTKNGICYTSSTLVPIDNQKIWEKTLAWNVVSPQSLWIIPSEEKTK